MVNSDGCDVNSTSFCSKSAIVRGPLKLKKNYKGQKIFGLLIFFLKMNLLQIPIHMRSGNCVIGGVLLSWGVI